MNPLPALSRAGSRVYSPRAMTLSDTVGPMAASLGADDRIVGLLREALNTNALPGELDGFSGSEEDQAAAFVAEVAAQRKPGEIAIQLVSSGGEAGHRRMRLAVVNDDMPFLVDRKSTRLNSSHRP